MKKSKDSICVLCNNYQEAEDAFDIFVSYLDALYPIDCSIFVDQFANVVDTYHDERYVFIDHNMRGFYKNYVSDFIWVDEFMEGIEQWDNRWRYQSYEII